jgi:glycosyltransferase involved in cell wall biosynthesis
MKVLHIDLGREMRGGQHQALALVKALGDEAVLMARAGSPLFESARSEGVEVIPASFRAVREITRSIDLAHAHDAHSHQWLALGSKRPFVVSRRVAFPVKRGFLSRWKYARAAHFLSVSDFVKCQLIKAGVSHNRISVVPDGVELPPSTSRGGCVLALRSADPKKGSALAEKAAHFAGIELEWADRLLEDLQRASLFVYLSESEGLGSAALHAMAAGVPVVASRVGGLVEIVRDNETGILTENQPHAVAAAIRRAIELRDELAANTRPFVERNFTMQHMVARTREVYGKVLA